MRVPPRRGSVFFRVLYFRFYFYFSENRWRLSGLIGERPLCGTRFCAARTCSRVLSRRWGGGRVPIALNENSKKGKRRRRRGNRRWRCARIAEDRGSVSWRKSGRDTHGQRRLRCDEGSAASSSRASRASLFVSPRPRHCSADCGVTRLFFASDWRLATAR